MNLTIRAELPARCHHCHWEGKVKDLVTLDNAEERQACPRCFQYDEIEIQEEP